MIWPEFRREWSRERGREGIPARFPYVAGSLSPTYPKLYPQGVDISPFITY